MTFDPVTGIIMGVVYGIPAYFGACLVRRLVCRWR